MIKSEKISSEQLKFMDILRLAVDEVAKSNARQQIVDWASSLVDAFTNACAVGDASIFEEVFDQIEDLLDEDTDIDALPDGLESVAVVMLTEDRYGIVSIIEGDSDGSY